jgi:hypothetical protein
MQTWMRSTTELGPPNDVQPIFVASHPRSGTHLLIDLLRKQFDQCASWKWPTERNDRLYCNIDELNGPETILSERKAHRVLGRVPHPIIKTHSFPDFQKSSFEDHDLHIDDAWISWLRNRGRFLYIVRDGREVMRSYHDFRKGFDQTTPQRIGSFMRQARHGMSRPTLWVNHIEAWRDADDVLIVRFEELIDTPRCVLREIAAHVELERPRFEKPILPKRFDNVWESRVARLFRIRPESTSILGHKGSSWKDRFTYEDATFFELEAGIMMRELGYESSSSWVQKVEDG